MYSKVETCYAENMKRTFYKFSKYGPKTAYKIGLAPLIGRVVLLLTTTGRKSGLPRVTPLQYELIDGAYIVAAVFGIKADWVRNLLAKPEVEVRVKNQNFKAQASVITDVEELTDFVEYRIRKRPRLIGFILRLDGFKGKPTREELKNYLEGRAMVKLVPK